MTHDVGTPHGTILHFKHPAQKGVQPLPPLKRSNNLDFQSLIELYVDHFDQIGTRGRQCRRLVAVKILNHDTFDHQDLILKFSILEIELG